MTPDRAPWTCPACGCGCAPWADSCAACAARQVFKWHPQQPTIFPTIQPVQPFGPWPGTFPVVPWPGGYTITCTHDTAAAAPLNAFAGVIGDGGACGCINH